MGEALRQQNLVDQTKLSPGEVIEFLYSAHVDRGDTMDPRNVAMIRAELGVAAASPPALRKEPSAGLPALRFDIVAAMRERHGLAEPGRTGVTTATSLVGLDGVFLRGR